MSFETINHIYCISSTIENWHLFTLLSLPTLKLWSTAKVSKIKQANVFGNQLIKEAYDSYTIIIKDAIQNKYNTIFVLMDTVVLNQKYFPAITSYLSRLNDSNIQNIISLAALKSNKSSLINWKAVFIKTGNLDVNSN